MFCLSIGIKRDEIIGQDHFGLRTVAGLVAAEPGAYGQVNDDAVNGVRLTERSAATTQRPRIGLSAYR